MDVPGTEEERRRRARLRNYFQKQDLFWPIGKWPQWAQDFAVGDRHGNRNRFNFFFFLWVNGLDIETAGSWTLLIDRVDGNSIYSAEPKHVRHIAQMESQARDDAERFASGKRMMDMTLGYVHEW